LPRATRPASPPALISVVMPVLNGEAHISEQLTALASQSYSGPWELVIVDNGCTDRTIEIVRSNHHALPAVRIADAKGKRGLSHARNVGAAAAQGDFLAYCDADDVVSPGWLEALAEAAPDCDLVGGRNEWERLNEPTVIAWRPSHEMTELMRAHDFLPYAPGGNLGVWRSVARTVGWDERFAFGGSDQVFAWRAQVADYRLAFAPDALVHLRFRRSIAATARQFYRYGRAGPFVHRAFREFGIPEADNRPALEKWRQLAIRLPDVFSSRARRGHWIRTAAFRLGRLVGSVRARALVL
jgi:glycosyltransferase involved in cell wall biosynthesis